MSRRVAIVDDDRAIRESLEDTLRHHGYDPRPVPNGIRLISLLQLDRPDVILLDVAMSWLDGVALCKALKANPRYRNIPVIMTSALASPADVERGLAAGALDYLCKPFDLEKLLTRLEEVIVS